MNIPKAYIGGFTKAIKLPRMLFIIYFANIFTALILAVTFNGVIKDAFGQSGILSTLLENFDFTTITETMFNHGDSIRSVLAGVKWLVIAYFLLSIFLTGGIIHSYNQDKFSTSSFFGGAAYNFFRFMGLSLLMIAVQLVFLLLVYIPLDRILKSVSENMTSEVKLYYIAIGGFVFYSLIFLLISMIGDYSKIYLVKKDSFNVFKGFWNGLKFVFTNFSKTYFLNLILLFIPGVIMYLYLYLERDIKMATVAGILIVFGMQQGFMLLRVFLRNWILASEYLVYNDELVKSTNKNSVVFSVVDTKTNTEKEIIEEPVKEAAKQPVKETAKQPVMETVKQPVIEPVKEEVKETIKEPVIEPATKKEEIKSGYQIDFSKTFTTNDIHEVEEEKIITEEEMIKKMNEEEILPEENLMETSDESLSETEEIQPTNIEKVEQNVIDVEDESGNETEKNKEEKPNKDIIEFEL